MKEDYYKTLGVAKDADGAAIKQSYRRMAMKYHPDRNAGDKGAEEKFKAVQEAYEVLSDEEKRAAYDRFGHAAFSGGRGNGAQGGPDFSSVFDDLFSDFFSSSSGARQEPRRRILSMRLSFEESITGCKKEIKLNEPTICESCHGSGGEPRTETVSCNACNGAGHQRVNRGFFTMQQTCGRCKGSGRIFKVACKTCGGEGSRRIARTISVHIPAGIQNGETMRLNISGLQDQFHLRVQVAQHPLFERDGDHLHISIPVSMTVAALGGQVQSPLPAGGKVKITVPPETQSGAILRLRGRGAPNVRNQQPGDMLCHILVETPVNLTDAQKKLLKSLDASLKKSQNRHSPQEQSWLDKAKSFFAED